VPPPVVPVLLVGDVPADMVALVSTHLVLATPLVPVVPLVPLVASLARSRQPVIVTCLLASVRDDWSGAADCAAASPTAHTIPTAVENHMDRFICTS